MSTSKSQLAQALRLVTPRGLRRAVGRVGEYLTADMRESIAFPSIRLALQTLRELGFSPRFCVDVGAYEGEWTRLFKSVFPTARVLMVEPQDAKRATLARVASEFGTDVKYEHALLGPQDDEVRAFYEMATGSSVYQEASPYPRVVVKKTTRTLDSILSADGYLDVDMLKLDVQGFEMEVLKGADRALAQSQAVLVETSLVPINAGCPSFAEVVEFLAKRSFHLFDFCSQVRRADGVLWQTDLLFIRADSAFAPRPELTRDNWR